MLHTFRTKPRAEHPAPEPCNTFSSIGLSAAVAHWSLNHLMLTAPVVQ